MLDSKRDGRILGTYVSVREKVAHDFFAMSAGELNAVFNIEGVM